MNKRCKDVLVLTQMKLDKVVTNIVDSKINFLLDVWCCFLSFFLVFTEEGGGGGGVGGEVEALCFSLNIAKLLLAFLYVFLFLFPFFCCKVQENEMPKNTWRGSITRI